MVRYMLSRKDNQEMGSVFEFFTRILEYLCIFTRIMYD